MQASHKAGPLAPVSYVTDGQRAPPQVYAALNAIGEVAWCINRPVLDALKHAGDRGMQIGSMPPLGDLPLRDTPKGSAFVVQRAPKWLNGQLHVTVRRAILHPPEGKAWSALLHHVRAIWDEVPHLRVSVLTGSPWGYVSAVQRFAVA